MEGKDDDSNNSRSSSINNTYINCPTPSDPRIGHSHPFYYCKVYPKFHNIHLEVIESHLILAKDRKRKSNMTRKAKYLK